jgi:hypothetical protein
MPRLAAFDQCYRDPEFGDKADPRDQCHHRYGMPHHSIVALGIEVGQRPIGLARHQAPLQISMMIGLFIGRVSDSQELIQALFRAVEVANVPGGFPELCNNSCDNRPELKWKWACWSALILWAGLYRKT